jgi:hypothetical protein
MLVIPSPQPDPPNRGGLHVTEWDPADPVDTGYRLGAKLNRFGAYQFLMIEQERTNDTAANGVAGTGAVTLGSSAPGMPLYASSSGNVSFRHPYFKLANFLSFGGSVEALKPTEDVFSTRRIAMPASN